MRITQQRTNHLQNPVGYRLDGLRFSWVTEEAEGKRQAAARLVIATDGEMTAVVFDSGRDEHADSRAYTVDMPLSPCTRYYWRVGVWTELGEYAESPAAFFETAKLDEPWRFPWIAADLPKDTHPLLRKDFTLSGKVKSARAYVAGLGIYELEINGQKCGDEYLLPGFHSYDNWVQYNTFDITDSLNNGANTIGARLGNGWYKGRLVLDFVRGMTTDIYGDRLCLRCEIRVEYADGTVEYLGTDESWRARGGEVTGSGIYDGEWQDARLITEGWNKPGLDTTGEDWHRCAIYTPEHTGVLSARLSPPVRVVEERQPTVIITPKNETVLDFGQIMTGWVRFDADAPEGTEITLQYGEILQDGCFYNENLRSAKAEFHYLSDGKQRMVRPYFTFYGFRYVKVVGWPGEADPARFTGCVVMTEMARTGVIKTAHDGINQLVENIVWGQKGNFLDVPTDCPQRDERLGWTGDAQIFCGTGCYNLYAPAFYHKYVTDMRYEQQLYHGSIPFYVPCPKKPDDDLSQTGHGSAAWADAATVVPWTLYLHYGDKALLAEHYPLMKNFVDYMIDRDRADGNKKLYQTGFHFADWLALDNFCEPDSAFGDTDMYYVASAYYAYSAGLVAQAAEALGLSEDARFYGERSAQVKNAIQKEYFTETGRCAINTQTASVVALFMDLLPDAYVKRTADALYKRLERRHMHLETGFVGTPYLCRVLSAHGMNSAAYTLLLNEDYPSWLYEVNMGATTVWERWNSVLPDGHLSGTGMNSLNHYAYGSIGEWLYRDVCGLNPVPEAPGFKKAVIAPKPDARMSWVNLCEDTASGRYEIAWEYAADNEWVLSFTVPFDCEAELRVPDGYMVNDAGSDTGMAKQVNNDVPFTAGQYTIRFTTP